MYMCHSQDECHIVYECVHVLLYRYLIVTVIVHVSVLGVDVHMLK